MFRQIFLAALAFGLCATAAAAVTVHPEDYQIVATEGGRTASVDGADLSDNAAVIGNGDINRVRFGDLDEDNDILIAGNLTDGDRDRWVFRDVWGLFSADLLNFAEAADGGISPFTGRFIVRVNGERVERLNLTGSMPDVLSASFTPLELEGDNVVIVARGLGGASDYDLAVNISPVPIPTSAVLLISGLLGAHMLARARP